MDIGYRNRGVCIMAAGMFYDYDTSLVFSFPNKVLVCVEQLYTLIKKNTKSKLTPLGEQTSHLELINERGCLGVDMVLHKNLFSRRWREEVIAQRHGNGTFGAIGNLGVHRGMASNKIRNWEVTPNFHAPKHISKCLP